MASLVQEYVDRLEGIWKQVRETVQGLDQADLNWTPLPQDTNSLAVLVIHLRATERFWMRQVIRGQDVHRDRAAEFASSAVTPSDLEAILNEAGQDAREVLSTVTVEQLLEERVVWGQTRTVQGCILYLIEHMADHLGHMQLTKQLYESGGRAASGSVAVQG